MESCQCGFITGNHNGDLITINMTKGAWEHFYNSLYNQVFLLLCTMGSSHFSVFSYIR